MELDNIFHNNTDIHSDISDQKSYISTVENTDLLSVDASITGGIPFLFPGVEASVTGEFEMEDKDTVSILTLNWVQ